MAEKTYVVAVAHENMKVGQAVTAEPTSRMEALLGAGYYYVNSVVRPSVEPVALEADDTDTALLERDEDQDVVEVVAPKRAASPKRTRVQ